MKRDSFVFYTSFSDAISELDEASRLAVYEAIVQYASTGDMPELSGVPKAIMTLIKPQIDANTRRYENGSLGGRPAKEEKENRRKTKAKPNKNQTETKRKPNVNVNVNDLEKEKIQKEKDGIDQPANPVNDPPTHEAHEVAGSAAAAKEAAKAPDPDFEAFWEAYGKKRGRRDVEAYWARLPARDKAAALSGVPGYVAANPDPAYRKDPIRYLRHRCWEDENYSTTDKKTNETHDTERPTAYMARYF